MSNQTSFHSFITIKNYLIRWIHKAVGEILRQLLFINIHILWRDFLHDTRGHQASKSVMVQCKTMSPFYEEIFFFVPSLEFYSFSTKLTERSRPYTHTTLGVVLHRSGNNNNNKLNRSLHNDRVCHRNCYCR